MLRGVDLPDYEGVLFLPSLHVGILLQHETDARGRIRGVFGHALAQLLGLLYAEVVGIARPDALLYRVVRVQS